MTADRPTVLFATIAVDGRHGTDLYTCDLAIALFRLGWRPVVFTSQIGPVARELRRVGIAVIDDLDRLSVAPDIIHGHHSLETLTALLRYPSAPCVFVTHDGWGWHSMPPLLQRVRAIIAVDENCRDRLIGEYGAPADRVRVFENAVDLRRFARRGPLPARPSRALVFSHAAGNRSWVEPITSACARRGIALTLAGSAENEVADPENLLPQFDLVFAKARCALEAMAVGSAVILADGAGLGSLVTSRTVETLRGWNFGMRTLQRAVTEEAVGAEIDQYDSADAARVSDVIRRVADVDLLAVQFAALYDEVRSEPVVCSPTEGVEAARYLRQLTSELYAQRNASPHPARGGPQRVWIKARHGLRRLLPFVRSGARPGR